LQIDANIKLLYEVPFKKETHYRAVLELYLRFPIYKYDPIEVDIKLPKNVWDWLHYKVE
jgi:hypothetical protein